MVRSRYAFGPFILDAERGALTRDGVPLSVGQRGLALLEALLAAEGGVVSKAMLMEQGWSGTVVEEGNLTVQIAGLRKALGEELIVTVPRVGYRLVRQQAAEAEPSFPLTPTLAVLPFVNLSGEASQDYFVDGVVEDIITALSRFRSFAVIARNSSFTYRDRVVDVRQVAAELGVRYVLEGGMRRAGDRLRVTAQLVDGDNAEHLWAEQFDGAVADVFDVQDRITACVAAAVEPSIQAAELLRSRRERPGSLAAYDLYLRALPGFLSRTISDHEEAYRLMTEVLALEPENAMILAFAGWSLSYRNAMGWPPIGPDDLERCAELVHRALQNAAGDAVVLGYCGMALLHTLKDYELAMAVFRSAFEANPNNMLVVLMNGIGELHCGSLERALAHLHQVIRLSPRDRDAHATLTGVAHCRMALGQYEEALDWATRSLALNPSYGPTYWMLVAGNAQLGRMDEARRHLARFREINPHVTITSLWEGQPRKDPSRIAAILDGLRLAGLPEE